MSYPNCRFFANWLVMLWLAVVLCINTFAQANPQDAQSVALRKGTGGYLGVYLGDVNDARAKDLKLAQARGAIVGRVEEESPAAKAGLQENDVILSLNATPIYNPGQVYRFLSVSAPGSKITLDVHRAGVLQRVQVSLGQRHNSLMDEERRLFGEADALLAAAEDRLRQSEEATLRGDEKEVRRLLDEEKSFRKESEERRAYIEEGLRNGKISLEGASKRSGSNITASRYQLGLRVVPLTEQLAKFFHSTSGGVLVTEIRVGEPAEQAGVKAGDCIVAINGEPVASPSDLNRLIERLDTKGGSELELSLMRERSGHRVKIKLSAR